MIKCDKCGYEQDDYEVYHKGDENKEFRLFFNVDNGLNYCEACKRKEQLKK